MESNFEKTAKLLITKITCFIKLLSFRKQITIFEIQYVTLKISTQEIKTFLRSSHIVKPLKKEKA